MQSAAHLLYKQHFKTFIDIFKCYLQLRDFINSCVIGDSSNYNGRFVSTILFLHQSTLKNGNNRLLFSFARRNVFFLQSVNTNFQWLRLMSCQVVMGVRATFGSLASRTRFTHHFCATINCILQLTGSNW